MRPRTLVILLASLIVLSIGYQVWFDQVGDGMRGLFSSSPEHSRKKGVYVCSMAATPSHLKIEGHDIIISKAWIEHNFTPAHHHPFSPYIEILPGYHLCVVLFDGDDASEEFIKNWEEAELIMSFDSAPVKGPQPRRFEPFPFSYSNGEFDTRTPNLLVGDLDTDLDRIDLHIEVPAVEYRDITSMCPEESSAMIRERIGRARELQRKRFHSEAKINCNARMGARQIKQHCELNDDSQELIRAAMTELNLSARAYGQILKVARTVADLEGKSAIGPEDVSEALQYRTFDRTLWV